MNKVYTIADVSNMLKVTKQCIYKKLNTLDGLKEQIITKKNKKYITISGIKLLVEDLNIEDFNINDFNTLNESNDKEKCLTDCSTINSIETTDLNTLVSNLNSQHNEQLKQITIMYENQIEHLKKESLDKTELIKNMQVLLKDHQLLLDSKTNKKWWQFWKS